MGILALIDEGETDWKVIAISNSSPLYHKLNNIKDVDIILPGVLENIKDWFRMYKTADGKPENEFGFGEKYLDKSFAEFVINETHESWKSLLKKNDTGGLWKSL